MCILDAVPGFVLELKKLETLHRHGNQNYFRMSSKSELTVAMTHCSLVNAITCI